MRNLYKFLSLVFVSCFVFMFMSCSPDDTSQKKKIVLHLSTKVSKFFKKSLDTNTAVNAKLTIKVKTSLSIIDKYNDLIVKINSPNSNPYIEVLLEDNNANQLYCIEEFAVGRGTVTGAYSKTNTDAKNFYSPKKGEETSSAVKKPLPITFKVSGGAISKVDGVTQNSLSIELISTKGEAMPSMPNQKIPSFMSLSKYFNYGIKTVKVGAGDLTDVIFKLEIKQNGKFSKTFYDIPKNFVNNNKAFPYFKLNNDDSLEYRFEISKSGYKTKEIVKKVSDMKKGTKSILISLDDVLLSDTIYVQYPTSSDFQRGGADFETKAYWDNLPIMVKDGALHMFKIKDGVPNKYIGSGSIGVDIMTISSKYDIPAGDYSLKLIAYEKSSTSTYFRVKLGNKSIWFSDAGDDSNTGEDIGNSKAKKLPSSAKIKTINVTGVTKGKILLSASKYSNDKIYFKILEIKKIN